MEIFNFVVFIVVFASYFKFPTAKICKFKLFNSSFDSKVLRVEEPAVEPKSPNIVWSKLHTVPFRSPSYAVFSLVELSKIRINLMSGAIFNKQGCISEYFTKTPEYHNRLRFLPGLSPGPSGNYAYEDYSFIDANTLIYVGGSLHSKDWQHAVIDFLPMFNFILPLVLSTPNITIIAGKYYRFFENIYPFSLARYIPKDYRYKTYRLYPIAPFFQVKKLHYVDIFRRDQSYLRPGAYDAILPFLHSNLSSVRGALSTRCQVVYLDRSQLVNDTQYVKTTGKIVGRNVVNQDALLAAIARSLKRGCKLVVWTCKNWLRDRDVLRDATVMMGPHGGHFVNMIFCSAGTNIVEFGRSYTMRQLHNVTGTGYRNARLVFAGMSSALGHTHWFVEDSSAIDEYLKKKIKPVWSDGDIVVNTKQVIDTLRAIGVSK